ncbi:MULTISPECIES: PfkB family carbohydrate kinase [Sphingobacterium]|uniref:PfkB family carbohydrate kinase n=1 Tax=Sphingobacterium TaxID=28453 RepID=UPI0008A3532D|nr:MULTISPECIES: PfkB family carbohydrate kinase [Sphingobacterium]OFV11844.1 hypothetical protein HMPREF3127_18445 [Sphingobacterium sp. HMSC13C05]HAF32594.1 hypothetical protein [Sphingobacterium sp.]HAL54071.1 hypothetical protein [Sphingobacterium sp.]
MGLKIIGGTYYEECLDPLDRKLAGSGLRAACALANKGIEIDFLSFISQKDKELAETICNSFGINGQFIISEETITFSYKHPLSLPTPYGIIENREFSDKREENLLFYGLKEANIKTESNYVVYDPQNGINFRDTGSKANHLALILNKKESQLISKLTDETDLELIGKSIIASENAEVVVIKNGSHGALVIEPNSINYVPIFKTTTIWPIGSGDIFSAAFALKWMIERLPAKDAALYASKSTADYCETRVLPIPVNAVERKPLEKLIKQKRIYLAGPFFDMGQRWFINECRNILLEFDNNVFSPLHDSGFGTPESIAPQNIDAIEKSDLIFAILNGKDPGTLFEIGFARALNKRAVIFYENVSQEDLFMLVGTGCECFSDFSTAIYSASW